MLGMMTKRKVVVVGLISIVLILSPLLLPKSVKDRVLFTFTQPEEAGQVMIGDVHLDTSTSARLVSWRDALKDWTRYPILGYGVTGYLFVDAQYPRVLTETGIIGFFVFMYLLYSILKMCLNNLKVLKNNEYKGICLGFLAGYIGLLIHALGANTFIIVRIMEPFWFFVGIMAVLPMLQRQQDASETGSDVSRTKLAPAS